MGEGVTIFLEQEVRERESESELEKLCFLWPLPAPSGRGRKARGRRIGLVERSIFVSYPPPEGGGLGETGGFKGTQARPRFLPACSLVRCARELGSEASQVRMWATVRSERAGKRRIGRCCVGGMGLPKNTTQILWP